jgi:hypothetical protein
MPVLGTCKLCLNDAPLLKSHYMPAAVYPTKRQKSATIMRNELYSGHTAHIKEHLLCKDCEDKFNHNGESEVLKWVAPRARKFSLSDRLKVALARETYPDIARYAAYEIGVDAAKFGYFALSVVWRGAIHQWLFHDGTRSTLLNLEPHQETIRRFLNGDTSAFPREITSVIVLVCSDTEARSLWTLPSQDKESGCDHIRFVLRGIFFRVLLEPTIPRMFRDSSCVSPRQCIWYGSSAHRMKQDFASLLKAPVK